MALNIWTKPSGYSLGVFPDREHIDIQLPVSGDSGVTFSVISGALPNGVFINGDRVQGSPYINDNILNYTFCIRATYLGSFSDRTFTLQIDNVLAPEFVTPAGELAAGVHKQFYVLDGSYVSYQIEAVDMNPIAGQPLKFYIADNSGSLPPGLTLSDSGLISGFLGPALASVAGTTHVFTMPYNFTVTVTDGITFNTRTFEIFVADPNVFRADSLMYDGLADSFTSDSTYLQQPVWLTDSYLGLFRANNYLTIPVSVYDNNSTSFRLEATNMELYASTFQILSTDNITNSTSLTITNASDVPVAGQYFTFYNYISIADTTVYRIYSVASLGGGEYRITLTTPLTFDIDNGYTFYIGSLSELPPGMNFDTATSEVYGRVPYQPAITTEYKFTITAVKSYVSSSEKVISSRTFTVDLLGDITSAITWNSSSALGTLEANYVSTLSVSATSSVPNTTIIYTQTAGSLPPGISLTADGELVGTVPQYYNELTGANGLITFDNATTTFDNNTTTFDRSYTFTVEASDQFIYSVQAKEFTIDVTTPNTVAYSNVYAVPFMSSASRTYWRSFITDTGIFTPSKIYRVNDPAFGVQSSMATLIYAGIETETANSYANNMVNGFKKKQFNYESIKSALAVDPVTGESVYEAIYVQLVDPLEPNGAVLPNIVQGSYYPNSISNWQARLSSGFLTERNYLPLWMRTIQPGTRQEVGYTLAVPLCYCKVGYSNDILLNITNSGFDFSTIDYTIDRFIVDSVLNSVGEQYLPFQNNRTTI